MNKRALHHIWTKLREVSYWYFLAVFIVCALLAAYTLRQNNLTALRLRDTVLQTDKNNGDVEAALKKLREFTYAHMNTDLATATGIQQPIQLKYRYDRLVAAEEKRVAKINAPVHAVAVKHCDELFPGNLAGQRSPCIHRYVTVHGVKENPIPDGLYKFDFVSPVWSPDVAGWSVVIAGLAMLLFVLRLLVGWWMKRVVND